MFEYQYTKEVNVAKLEEEIRASSIPVALENISLLGDSLSIFFKAQLSASEITTLDGLVSAHVNTPDVSESMKVVIDQPKDTDGAIIVRGKQAPQGWHYQSHTFEFCLSKLNSTVCINENDVPYGFTTIKLYDSSNVEITDQPNADINCVKTVIDWEPNHDFEILSGKLYFKDMALDEPVRLWVIGAPDIPYAYGGSRYFATGLNLDFLDAFQPIETDGRVSKYMKYDPVLHTNKFRFIFKHNAGKKLDIMFVLELYKA